MSYRVSYAQNREDIVLDAYFSDVTNGFYVDVGANHPYYHSVTKLFYDKGWSGINFEPNPKLHTQLEEQRSRDENIRQGVSNKKGTLKLRVYHSSDGLEGISTFSNKMKADYDMLPDDDSSKFDDIEVEVTTLKDVFEQQKPKHIHFMKVDVEGYEYEALEGNDWNKYRPEMICIEANHIVRDWRPLLKKAGYVCVHNDGLNDYYLADESMSRAANFDYVKTILGNIPIVTIDMHEKLTSAQDNIQYLNQMTKSLKKSLSSASSENKRLRELIEEITPLRKHVKRQLKHHVGKHVEKRKG